MKKIFSLLTVAAFSLISFTSFAQAKEDKSKRPSPPAEVSEKITTGATITINYSQPSIKGRMIGKDLEPMTGKVWRTGANEATTFATDKEIKVNGSMLPAGKYSLFTIAGDAEWTIIFNKKADQWGAFDYKEADDALRVKAAAGKADKFAEKMTFTIAKNGTVDLFWGDNKVGFTVQ